MARPLFSARRWHQYAGLVAFLWLAVLGLTGWLMANREEWPWLWEHGLPAEWLPAEVVKTARSGLLRWLQAYPADERRLVGGGYQGAWYSSDGGKTWSASRADHAAPLNINALEAAPDWSVIWYGTQDGIWASTDLGETLHRYSSEGTVVTALTLGPGANELTGVAGRTRVFTVKTSGANVTRTWLELGPPDTSPNLPAIALNRTLIDWHYGRGVLGTPWDRWVVDFTGLGLVVLGLTGFILWWMPRSWRLARVSGKPVADRKARTQNLRLHLGIHARWLGPVLALPLVLLFITGVYLGHFAALSPAAKRTNIPSFLTPPAYGMRNWDGWIESVLRYPGEPSRISLGTRTGLFTSTDLGRNWRLEEDFHGGAYKLRRFGSTVLSPGTMSSTTRVLTPSGWRDLGAGTHVAMASEVTPMSDHRLLWKHGSMVHISDEQGLVSGAKTLEGPVAQKVPLYTIAARLHDSALISREWKWVNDLFAGAGLILIVTGLVRWWRLHFR